MRLVLVTLLLFSGCAPSIYSPYGIENWINANVPPTIKCDARARMAETHLNRYYSKTGWYCSYRVRQSTKTTTHAYLECCKENKCIDILDVD